MDKISNSFKKKLAAAEHNAALSQRRERAALLKMEKMENLVKTIGERSQVIAEALEVSCGFDPSLIEQSIEVARERLGYEDVETEKTDEQAGSQQPATGAAGEAEAVHAAGEGEAARGAGSERDLETDHAERQDS